MTIATTPRPSPSTPPTRSSRIALRPKEAARELGVGLRTLWRLTFEAKEIPHFKVGRAVMYRPEALAAWALRREQNESRAPGSVSP